MNEKQMASFETYLVESLNHYASKSETLVQAMTYSLQTGGKRFRPMLLLAAVEFGKGSSEKANPTAAALEWIHTYSLIHDDLPAMDDDDYRRGKETTHKKFNEAAAILAGDALLTAAFTLILDQEDLEPVKKVELAKQLAIAAGPDGMIAGQIGDIEGEEKELTIDELATIHKNKTGALIEFAVYAGCVLADLSENAKINLMGYAEHLGLAYQIHNDLKDILLDSEASGKKAGKDQELGKNTYPSILGVDQALAMLESEIQAAVSHIETIKETVDPHEVNMEQLEIFLNLLDYVKIGTGV